MASMEIKTEPEDVRSIHQLCRLCLNEEFVDSIFAEEGLHQWISDYLSITVSVEDNMSQSICSICRIRLTEFHQFRVRCQEVQDIMQSTSWPSVDEVQMKMDPETAMQVRQNLHNHLENHKDKALECQEAKVLVQKQNTKDELRGKVGYQTRNDLELNKSISYDHVEHSEIAVKLEPTVLDSSYQIEQDPLGLEDMTGMERVKVENRKDDMETVNDESTENEHSADIGKEQPSIAEVVHTNTEQETMEATQHQCDICSKVFPYKLKLTQHKRKHRKNHSCPICAMSFSDSCKVQRHMRSHLTVYERNHEPKPFRCDICLNSFVSRDTLASHRKYVHKVPVNNKPKECLPIFMNKK